MAIDENEAQRLSQLKEILKNVGLDFNWLYAVSALSAQEIAVKKKLNELGETYGEEDFQKIAEKLIDVMNKRKMEPPDILLSIARSYRHIRAKVIHAPHKTRIKKEEADAIFNNTLALIMILSKNMAETDLNGFIESIDISCMEQRLKEFSKFDEQIKIHTFEKIMNKFSLLESWEELTGSNQLFDFIKAALKMEPDIKVQGSLFETILNGTLIISPSWGKEKLLHVIAEFTRLSNLRELIKSKGYIGTIISEFEMSNSFDLASINAEVLLNIANFLDTAQINRVADAILSNDQIYGSYGARSSIKKFISIHSSKIDASKMKQLDELLR